MTTLKALRKEYNLTQKLLASNIGLTQRTIAAYESGDRTPSVVTAMRIARYFGVNTEAINWKVVNGADEEG